MVVQGGRVSAVGPAATTEMPAGVTIVDAAGKVLTPAFVHAGTRLGLRGNGGGNANLVDASRRVEEELDPWLDENRWAAANGFATLGLLPGEGIVGGRGAAVRAAGADIESMLRRADTVLRVDVTQGARFSNALAGQLAAARKDLDALAKWETERAAWEKAKAAAEAEKKPVPAEPKKPDQPDDREPYRKVLRGETALWCLVGNSADVVALRDALADEAVRGAKLRLVCALSGDAYRAAPELLDLGARCVVRASLASWPNSDLTVCPAVLLRNAGLPVALLPRDDSRDGLRNFRIDLAGVVSAGFPRAAALRAATAETAALLGLGEGAGTIAAGARADFVLWTGDPLQATSRLERVWIDGRPVEETP